MSFVKRLLFMCSLVVGLSFAAMAQKDGDKQKPPPKGGNPPVINPKDKPPPKETPKPTPKKPGMEALVRPRESDSDLA